MSGVPTSPPSEWDDFRRFAQYIKSLSGIVTAAGTILPLSGFVWSAWTPPWPPGSYVISAVVSLLTILLLFLVYRQSQASELPTRRCAIILYLIGLGTLALYVVFFRFLTVSVGDDMHVTGFGLTEEARNSIGNDLVANTPKDLLDYYGHQSEDRIWRFRSPAYLVLLLTFVAGGTLVVTGFCLLVIRAFVLDKVAAQMQHTIVPSTK